MKPIRLILSLLVCVPMWAFLGACSTLDNGHSLWWGLTWGTVFGFLTGLAFGGAFDPKTPE